MFDLREYEKTADEISRRVNDAANAVRVLTAELGKQDAVLKAAIADLLSDAGKLTAHAASMMVDGDGIVVQERMKRAELEGALEGAKHDFRAAIADKDLFVELLRTEGRLSV